MVGWNENGIVDIETDRLFEDHARWMSSVTNTLKVVDMTIDGKYHRTNWMSPEGVEWLMGLLMDDYSEKVWWIDREACTT